MVIKGLGLRVEQLLNALSTFLNSKGGIKSEDDCVKFHKLLDVGAWDTLYEWLNDYKELDESPILVLLLETFQRLPVTMDMLKSNSTAKIIKSLRKHTDEDLKLRATETVDKWMMLIKSKTGSSTPSASTSTDKNGEHKDKEKKKKRHKNSAEKSEDKNVDIPPDRDVPSPPPPSIFKETPKTNSDRTERATAKQHSVKERSAGVEAGVIKPKPRGSKPPKPAPESPVASKSSSNINPPPQNGSGSHTLPSSSSSYKRANIELPGISEPSEESKKPKIDIDKEEDFGKAKLIAPLPKPAHVVSDSGGFMAALLQPRTPLVKKKKTAQAKTPTSPTEKSSPPNTPLSPVSAPPSFYKDTLEGPSGVSPPLPLSLDSADRMSPVESTVSSHSEESKPEPMDTSAPATSKPTASKKKVSWKAEKELREYHYFELLEDERVNVNRIKDQGGFGEMKKREMLSESAALKNIHLDGEKGSMKHSNALPTVTEKFAWKKPALLDLPVTANKVDPGYMSKERTVQTTREVSVLAAIYFSKASMPASAAEPDHSTDSDATGTTDSTLSIPLEVTESVSYHTPQDTYEPTPVPAPVLAAPVSATAVGTIGQAMTTVGGLGKAVATGGIGQAMATVGGLGQAMATVADLVPGVTANDMDLIQKLANGEAGHDILEVLANTNPDYLNQIMQTEGISPLEANGSGYNANHLDTGGYMGVPPPLMSCPPPGYNPEIKPLLDNNQMRGGYHHPHMAGRGWHGGRGGGPRGPPFNRGGGVVGFRGGWRGRGGPRGGGRGGPRIRECHHFQKLGKCDYGTDCSFVHTR